MPKDHRPPQQGELRTLLRDLLVAEAGLEQPTATRIADLCTEAIDRRYFTRGDAGSARQVETEERLLLPERPFDPYSFGAVAILMSEGRPALAAKLDQIKRAEDLHLLARSQRLSVDPELSGVEELRAAIMDSAERRIAARRRAASAR
jgi:hypothetical protein